MDYPKSVPGVGLVDGKFVDEDLVAGRPGSLIPATWGNAVTEELLAVIRHSGLEPSESVLEQLVEAIWTQARADFKGVAAIATLAEAQLGEDDEKIITPAILAAILEELVPGQATEEVAGLVKLATTLDAQALTDDASALTPKKLADALAVTSLGREQSWQDVTASRVMGVTYTNTTGKPILVWISANQPTGAGTAGINLAVNGHTVIGPMSYGANSKFSASILVPVGATYSAAVNVVVGGADGIKWSELRD